MELLSDSLVKLKSLSPTTVTFSNYQLGFVKVD